MLAVHRAPSLPLAQQQRARPKMGKGGHSNSNSHQEKTFRSHNFSAGPGMCETRVMKRIQENFLNYEGSGMGVHETSHRDEGGNVQMLLKTTENQLRTLLEVPDNYKILFCQVGYTRPEVLLFLLLTIVEPSDSDDLLLVAGWSAWTVCCYRLQPVWW